MTRKPKSARVCTSRELDTRIALATAMNDSARESESGAAVVSDREFEMQRREQQRKIHKIRRDAKDDAKGA